MAVFPSTDAPPPSIFCQERHEKENSNPKRTYICMHIHNDKSLHFQTRRNPFSLVRAWAGKRSLPQLSVPPDERYGCVFFLPHVNLNIVAAAMWMWIHTGLLPEHHMQCIAGAQKDFCPPLPLQPIQLRLGYTEKNEKSSLG